MVGDMNFAKTHYTDGGNMSGAVYTAEEDHWKFIGNVLAANITSNPLHFFEFPHIS